MSALPWRARHRPRSRYAQQRADIEALDRGVIEAGVTAGNALTKMAAIELALTALDECGADGVGREETASFGDPASARIQARKRRIEASGLRVVRTP